MTKRKKFAMADTELDFIQILAEDSDLAKRLEKALSTRIAREFFEEKPAGKRSPKKKEARDE